jgi:septal ring factor EnvC (AmiA/AmiB activator)
MSIRTARARAGRAALVAALAFVCPPAFAENATPTPSASPDAKSAKELELRGVEDTLKASEEQRRKIEADVEALKVDHVRLNAALIETTAKVQATEAERAEAQAKLSELTAHAAALGKSLDARREVIADAFGALERLGANPPPAILVKPNAMTDAIRAAMTIGGAVPPLQAEIQAAADDLAALEATRVSIARQRDDLAASAAGLALDKTRLTDLIAARQQSLNAAEDALDAERKRAAELANQALSLKDLIARMEAQSPAARAGAQAAAAAEGSPAGSKDDPGRLKPAVAFVDAKGTLSLPTAGQVLKTFGDADDYGGSEKGVSIATPPKATVSTPIDGWVVYAGPYRSYGQLLILNAGGGYYLVMAGMERTNVSVGQFVLTGEAVASMGDAATRTAAAAAIGAAQPVLYIEFRKNETPIDPGPWWAKTNNEKAHG